MKKFQQRFDSTILAQLNIFKQTVEYRNSVQRKQTRLYREKLKELRSGDYLIKIGKNNNLNWCGPDKLYLDYTYGTMPGWFSLGARVNAQWFTGPEVFEILQKLKGFTAVRRKRN